MIHPSERCTHRDAGRPLYTLGRQRCRPAEWNFPVLLSGRTPRSWRRPGAVDGTGPIAATSPFRLAAICTFMPAKFTFPENRYPGIAFQSHVGQTVPSTRAVPRRPSTCAGSGTNEASALPITGRRRSHLLLTVGWLHLKTFAAAAWTILRRISATTRTTERKRFTAGGFFAPGLVMEPISAVTMMLSLVSCPQVRPVRS